MNTESNRVDDRILDAIVSLHLRKLDLDDSSDDNDAACVVASNLVAGGLDIDAVQAMKDATLSAAFAVGFDLGVDLCAIVASNSLAPDYTAMRDKIERARKAIENSSEDQRLHGRKSA